MLTHPDVVRLSGTRKAQVLTHPDVVRLSGTRAVLEDAVQRILGGWTAVQRMGVMAPPLVLVFDSKQDPTFQHYQVLSSILGVDAAVLGDAFEWRGVRFQAAAELG